MQAVAEASGTTVREIKRLNPAFRADEIPEGSHQVKLPAGSAGDFEKKIDLATRATSEEIPADGRQTDERWRDLKSSGASGNAPRGRDDRGRSARREDRTSKIETTQVKSKSTSKSAAHTVTKGETLSSIAARYKVSAEALKKANKLKSSNVSPGQKLVIP